MGMLSYSNLYMLHDLLSVLLSLSKLFKYAYLVWKISLLLLIGILQVPFYLMKTVMAVVMYIGRSCNSCSTINMFMT